MFVLLSFLYPSDYVAVNSYIPVFMLLSSPQLSFMTVLIIVCLIIHCIFSTTVPQGSVREGERGREIKGRKVEGEGGKSYIPVFMLLSTTISQCLCYSKLLYSSYCQLLYSSVMLLSARISQCLCCCQRLYSKC